MEGWSRIISFITPQDAYMAKAYLEAQGIPVMLQDEMTVQVNNFYSNAIGGVKLWVRNEDFRQAAEWLEKGGYIVPEADVEENWVWVKKDKTGKDCPFCHSENIGKSGNLSGVALILFFIFGCLFPIFRTTWKCYDCGKAWKYKNR